MVTVYLPLEKAFVCVPRQSAVVQIVEVPLSLEGIAWSTVKVPLSREGRGDYPTVGVSAPQAVIGW